MSKQKPFLSPYLKTLQTQYTLTKGWLKRILCALSKELKTGKFNTPACRNILHSNYRGPIVSTAY